MKKVFNACERNGDGTDGAFNEFLDVIIAEMNTEHKSHEEKEKTGFNIHIKRT